MSEPHPYRAWVDENDVGNTCCLLPRLDPIHLHPRSVRINVRGEPHPQGSLRAFKVGNKVATQYPPAVWAWRHQVQQAIVEAQAERFDGAVELGLGFDLLRPRSHFLPVNSRRSEPEVGPSAPAYPTAIPDLDKLIRAIADAATDAGLWKDDSQVCSIRAAKRYVSHLPGVLITVTELEAL